jgi:hypothetical protein
VGLERGPLSLVRIIEEELNGKVAAPGIENRDYGRGDPLRLPRNTLYQLKLALTLPTGRVRSVGIVRLRTKTTEFFLCWSIILNGFCLFLVGLLDLLFDSEDGGSTFFPKCR